MQGIPKMDPSLAMLRPFGRAQDLELEFANENRPALVTALLDRCSDAADSDYWWDQTVGVRIAALLRVLLLTEGHDGAISVTLRCPEPQCGKTFEIELPVDALSPARSAGGIAAGEDVGAIVKRKAIDSDRTIDRGVHGEREYQIDMVAYRDVGREEDGAEERQCKLGVSGCGAAW